MLIVKQDAQGNKTYYRGSTSYSKDSISAEGAADKVVSEIVTPSNLVTPTNVVSKDEMDRGSSTPQWFYIGAGSSPYGYGGYTYCPAPVNLCIYSMARGNSIDVGPYGRGYAPPPPRRYAPPPRGYYGPRGAGLGISFSFYWGR